MAVAANKITIDQSQDEKVLSPESRLEKNHLRLVADNVSGIREEIGRIARHSFEEGVLKAEYYEGYMKLATGREEYEVTNQMLATTLEFARKYDQKAVALHQKIEKAMNDKIASKGDEEFLMKFVIDNMNFVEEADQISASFDRKIARMKKDREKYDSLSKHPLAKGFNVKKVEAKQGINLGKIDSFLAATVPERRAFLREIKEAIEKEEWLEALNEKNAESMVLQYKEKLDRRLADEHGKNGSIGNKTHKAYLQEFEKLAAKNDFKTMNYWNQEFENEMAPRDAFWGVVRSTLQEEGLKKMESKIHHLGLKDLRKLYSKVKKSESGRVKKRYLNKLKDEYGSGEIGQNKIIGKHSQNSFAKWIENIDFKEMYLAESQMTKWEATGMFREIWDEFHDLRNIEKLTEEEFHELQGQIDSWGYTEYKNKLKEIRARKIPKKEDNETPSSLNKIKNSSVRNSVKELNDNLEDRPESQFDKLIDILERQGKGVKTVSFEEKVQEVAANTQPPQKEVQTEANLRNHKSKPSHLSLALHSPLPSTSTQREGLSQTANDQAHFDSDTSDLDLEFNDLSLKEAAANKAPPSSPLQSTETQVTLKDLKKKEQKVIERDTFKEVQTTDGEHTAREVVVSERAGLDQLFATYQPGQNALNTQIRLLDENQQTLNISKSDAANMAEYFKKKREEKQQQEAV